MPMQMREIKAGQFVFWHFGENDKLLCRVRYVGRDYVSCTVLTATCEQVIASGYGVGEPLNTRPESLEPVVEK